MTGIISKAIRIIAGIFLLFVILGIIMAPARAADVSNEEAGVCAVYLEAVKADKKLVAEVWKRAPDIAEARFAAQLWQIGASGSRGAVLESYRLEGERACEGIITWSKP
ncbi:MAG TPA: hypothetical protein VJT81_05595 [Burkholderiales bacterium]|nr:hypothetical protein [Burkholderiales bacterium]